MTDDKAQGTALTEAAPKFDDVMIELRRTRMKKLFSRVEDIVSRAEKMIKARDKWKKARETQQINLRAMLAHIRTAFDSGEMTSELIDAMGRELDRIENERTEGVRVIDYAKAFSNLEDDE